MLDHATTQIPIDILKAGESNTASEFKKRAYAIELLPQIMAIDPSRLTVSSTNLRNGLPILNCMKLIRSKLRVHHTDKQDLIFHLDTVGYDKDRDQISEEETIYFLEIFSRKASKRIWRR
jgi:hypothetical protein